MHDIDLEQDIFVFTKIITTRNPVSAVLAIQHPVPAEVKHGPAHLSPHLSYLNGLSKIVEKTYFAVLAII